MANPDAKYGVSGQLPSEEELVLVEQIRVSCKAELEALTEKPDDVVGDLRICRFLRSRHGDVTAASEWYREFLRWRVEKDVEADRREVIGRSPEEFIAWFAKRCNPHMPMTPYVGRNPEGHVLFFIRPGMLHGTKFVQHRQITMAQDAKFLFQTLEWVLWYLDVLSRKEGRMVYVIKLADFKGLGEGKPVPFFVPEFKAFIADWTKLMQRYYCDHDSIFLLINTNMLFRAVFSLLKLLLTKRQTSKVRVLGDVTQENARATLEQYLPKALLPEVYGGQLKTAVNSYPLATEEEIQQWYDERHLLPAEPVPASQPEAMPQTSPRAANPVSKVDPEPEAKPKTKIEDDPTTIKVMEDVTPSTQATSEAVQVEEGENVVARTACCVWGR